MSVAARRAGTGALDAGLNRPACGDLLTTDEAAQLLRRQPKTLRAWRYRGQGPNYVSGGRVTYHRADIEAWLDARYRRPAEPASGGLVRQGGTTT